MSSAHPLITNDAVVLGLLVIILAVIFKTSHSEHPFWKKFYSIIPSLLLCYFVPSLLNTAGIISGDQSHLYYVASRYLLPASLVLLTVSIDLPEIMRLGPKAVIMFLTGSVGVIIGGPIALIVMSYLDPSAMAGTGSHAIWRGMSTIAGSWIGGGANQTAMKEVFKVNDDLFSMMITVDVIVSNVWLGILLYGAERSEKIDRVLKADVSAIEKARRKIAEYRANIARIPDMADVMTVLAVGFGVTAIGHLVGNSVGPYIHHLAPYLDRFSLSSPFFWIVIVATTLGLILSFTPLRKLEGVGASRIGSVFLYILVATIGMKMNIMAIFENPSLFFLGIIWILIHIGLLIFVAKMIKAPFFFVAVGSQANIGGAASAPIVASAFDSSLAPVGVLLAVLGYALGTYGAWFCAIIMEFVSRGHF